MAVREVIQYPKPKGYCKDCTLCVHKADRKRDRQHCTLFLCSVTDNTGCNHLKAKTNAKTKVQRKRRKD